MQQITLFPYSLKCIVKLDSLEGQLWEQFGHMIELLDEMVYAFLAIYATESNSEFYDHGLVLDRL